MEIPRLVEKALNKSPIASLKITPQIDKLRWPLDKPLCIAFHPIWPQETQRYLIDSRSIR